LAAVVSCGLVLAVLAAATVVAVPARPAPAAAAVSPASERPAVFRNGRWFLRNANSSGASTSFTFGLSGDLPVTWSVSRCSPAYPTVCIPPPPPDLDCGNVRFRNFRVLAPDPHRFDGDHDGVGCKT
jgi:hypothetical protein